MTNKLKLRIINIFRSPLCTRWRKGFSDVTDHPFFYPQNNQHHHLFQLLSPEKPPPSQPFPSICRPKTTPPLNKPKQRKSRKKTNNSQLKNKKFDELLDLVSGNYSNYWFTSSDDENEVACGRVAGLMRTLVIDQNEAKDDEETTLFSSKSLSSSDLSEEPQKGFKDSFAVVKRSSDPYNDFRTSMVEMIVERQLFGAKDLERLLHCFLALNSTSHHLVIVEVFTQIWETMFSDWQ